MLLKRPAPAAENRQARGILAAVGIGPRPLSSLTSDELSDKKSRVAELLANAGATAESALREIVDISQSSDNPNSKFAASKFILELHGVSVEESETQRQIIVNVINPENVNMMNILCPS